MQHDRTALHEACIAKHIVCASLLIAAGADIDAMDRGRWTPIFFSVWHGWTQVTSLLLAAGADTYISDRVGTTLVSCSKYLEKEVEFKKAQEVS